MDTLYEIANEIFDDIVFADERDLCRYNSDETPVSVKYELDEHIAAMCQRAEDAMIAYAREHKADFIEMVWEV